MPDIDVYDDDVHAVDQQIWQNNKGGDEDIWSKEDSKGKVYSWNTFTAHSVAAGEFNKLEAEISNNHKTCSQ